VNLDACVHFKPRIEGLLATKRGERVHHLFLGALTVNQQVIDHAYTLLSRRRPDWSLDQPFYVDQGFFDLEMKRFQPALAVRGNGL